MWSVSRTILVTAALLLVPVAPAHAFAFVQYPPDLDNATFGLMPDGLDRVVDTRFVYVADYNLGALQYAAVQVQLSPGFLPSPTSEAPNDPLHAPWGLVALPFSQGVFLKWNAPLEGEPYAYRVYRSIDDNPAEAIAQVAGDMFVDATAWSTNGTVIAYSVTALSMVGGGSVESPPSNPAFVPGMDPSCPPFWLGPASAPTFVDFALNPRYLECVQAALEEVVPGA